MQQFPESWHQPTSLIEAILIWLLINNPDARYDEELARKAQEVELPSTLPCHLAMGGTPQKEAIMKQVELVTGILYRLKQLARQTGTDVEGVVSWLAFSYNPAEAMSRLLE